MKVKIIKKYIDAELKKIVDIGEELNVTKERGIKLINSKVAKEIIEKRTNKK